MLLPEGVYQFWTQTKDWAWPRLMVSNEGKRNQRRFDSHRGWWKVLAPRGALGTRAECWGGMEAETDLK